MVLGQQEPLVPPARQVLLGFVDEQVLQEGLEFAVLLVPQDSQEEPESLVWLVQRDCEGSLVELVKQASQE